MNPDQRQALIFFLASLLCTALALYLQHAGFGLLAGFAFAFAILALFSPDNPERPLF